MSRGFIGIIGLIGFCGCGVKGDPMPPEKPAHIGQGNPNYRRATKGIKLEKLYPEENEELENEGDEEGENE